MIFYSKNITYHHFNQYKEWRKGGLCHRENGPAIIYLTGARVWCQFDYPHRDDGPAVIYADGSREWWVNGKPIKS